MDLVIFNIQIVAMKYYAERTGIFVLFAKKIAIRLNALNAEELEK